ncbi:MAG: hypothetical protein PsegKO_27100 [Pseudohongiellaceae bacterium]|jgi:hypothetical protein
MPEYKLTARFLTLVNSGWCLASLYALTSRLPHANWNAVIAADFRQGRFWTAMWVAGLLIADYLT